MLKRRSGRGKRHRQTGRQKIQEERQTHRTDKPIKTESKQYIFLLKGRLLRSDVPNFEQVFPTAHGEDRTGALLQTQPLNLRAHLHHDSRSARSFLFLFLYYIVVILKRNYSYSALGVPANEVSEEWVNAPQANYFFLISRWSNALCNTDIPLFLFADHPEPFECIRSRLEFKQRFAILKLETLHCAVASTEEDLPTTRTANIQTKKCERNVRDVDASFRCAHLALHRIIRAAPRHAVNAFGCNLLSQCPFHDVISQSNHCKSRDHTMRHVSNGMTRLDFSKCNLSTIPSHHR